MIQYLIFWDIYFFPIYINIKRHLSGQSDKIQSNPGANYNVRFIFTLVKTLTCKFLFELQINILYTIHPHYKCLPADNYGHHFSYYH